MKQKIIILVLMLFVAIVNTKAQSIFIYFTDGTINEYPLSELNKITFSETDMLLHKTDATIINLNMSDIKKYNYDAPTKLEKVNKELSQFDILIYPNPSNGAFKLEYKVNIPSEVNISILSIDGRFIETILSERKDIGSYSLSWKNPNVQAGSYFIKIQSGNDLVVKKVIILK